MTLMKERVAASLRRLEQRLGIDREGRTVWVWLIPPAIGLASAILVPFMPGLPDDMSLIYRLALAVFALVTMTVITSIYLITFDNDHNQQAPLDNPQDGRDDGGLETPPAPSGSPPPKWLGSPAPAEKTSVAVAPHLDEPREVRVPAGTRR